VPVLVLDEFLVADELKQLMQFALAREAQFRPSEVIAPHASESRLDFARRRSAVLFDLGSFHQLFEKRMLHFLSHIHERLGMPAFTPSHVEAQMTASNHGDFFRAHTDNGHTQSESRTITFVYFFHREPTAFSGGELRLYRQNGTDRPNGDAVKSVVPAQNRAVLFPSGCFHEISPVGVPSRQFADSRFTVNGWIHR
jgi:Rps23 Pro-64 3,4-dihydroxylase Tpa1-like proline 4-hydroxylase